MKIWDGKSMVKHVNKTELVERTRSSLVKNEI